MVENYGRANRGLEGSLNPNWFLDTKPIEWATVRRRSVAHIIDWIMLSFLDALVSSLGNLFDSEELTMASAILSLAIPIFYFVWPYSTGGQTIGKGLLGIKVVSLDGTPLNWRKGILRTGGYFLSSIPLDLGFFWALWDKDKQAWHDKIAGTGVVCVSVTAHQLQYNIDPSEARRRQRRWLLGLGVGIPTLLVLVCVPVAFVFLYVIGGQNAELRNLDPWPGPEISLQQAVDVDLSNLGLEKSETSDARQDPSQADGNYGEGIRATYNIDDKSIVEIYALRYDDEASATGDFRSLLEITQSACGVHTSTIGGNTGVIHCLYNDTYRKWFWNGSLIVEIVAREGSEFEPPDLVDKVRDALANHWKKLREPAEANQQARHISPRIMPLIREKNWAMNQV